MTPSRGAGMHPISPNAIVGKEVPSANSYFLRFQVCRKRKKSQRACVIVPWNDLFTGQTYGEPLTFCKKQILNVYEYKCREIKSTGSQSTLELLLFLVTIARINETTNPKI